MVIIQSGGNLSPNWSQLDGNVTSEKMGAIKDIWSNSGQVGGNAGKLPWEAFPYAARFVGQGSAQDFRRVCSFQCALHSHCLIAEPMF
jgi:hypothetical protein